MRFHISAYVQEIFFAAVLVHHQKFKSLILKIPILPNNKCVGQCYVLRMILDICPRVESVKTSLIYQMKDATLAFLSEAWDTKETVDVSEESEPEPKPVKRKTASKSISKTEAEEAEAARQVHATHARIVTESIPKPTRRRKSGKVTSDPPKKLKGVPSLTPEEQEAADTMQALKESRKTSKRQPESEYSEEDQLGDEEKDDKDDDANDEGDAYISDNQDADDEDAETESDKDEIYKYKIRVRKDEDVEMSNAKVEDSDKGDEEVTDAAKAEAEKTSEVKDDSKKTKHPPTSSSLSVSSDAEINSLLEVKIQYEVPHIQSPSMLRVPVYVISEPLVLTPVQESPSIATVTTLPPLSISTTPPVPQQTTTPIPTPLITTDAPTITTVVSEFDALSDVQLRVAKLEKDVSELKKIDLSVEALAALKTQVPSDVDNYLGSKVGDVFQKELKKHTADLIQKYSLQQIPKLPKNQTPIVDLEQESEKSPLEILKIKKEQGEKQKMPKFTIKFTDKAALKEFDQEKFALYQTKQCNKSFNKNLLIKRLYHGKKTKRRRTKESESSKKPSTTKETPKGKAPSKGSKTGKSASAKEPVEEPTAEVVMDDAGEDVVHDDDQPQDTSEPKTTKTLNPEWFTQPPRPPTPDPEWNKRQVVLDQPEQPWFNQMVSATKDPLTFNDLMATPIDFSKYVLNRLKIDNLTQDILLGPAYNLLKGTCSSSIELEYHF
ncbi:hypothetical protein Tco_1235890 [Tanacetum coccineum]